ncbi:GGDEF domain-containing protein [Glaciecola siphonariae]|uniref:diguanylate cyclase n=1 Tax=Glaciecola siphonariae TaxID=521012 RepID=A0ABV9LZ46_9ALTE
MSRIGPNSSSAKRFGAWLPDTPHHEKFLVRSVFAISAIGLLLITPFAILNLVNARMFVGFASLSVLVVCLANIYKCTQGKYVLAFNLLGLAPALGLSVIFAIKSIGVMGVYWAYMAVCAYYLVLPLRHARYANILLFLSVTAAAYLSLEQAVYLRFSVTLFGCSLFMYFCFGEIDKQRRLLKARSETDPLTQCLNRATLITTLSDTIAKCAKNKQTATICAFDLDHFKPINDTHGHDVGDQVLISFAQLITQYMSANDKLFRVGGEEFLLLMTNASEAEGFAVAEAMRAVVESTQLHKDIDLTVSAGVCEVSDEYTWREWMKASDQKLYAAKQNGRNQVVK